MSLKPTWISEEKASELTGYKPETLRRYVKDGRLDITFTHIRNRNFKYDQKDIEQLFNKNAKVIA